MLAANAKAFLRVGHTFVRRRLVAQNDIFELVHAGVGEHQRRVVLDHHRCRWNDVVAVAGEEILERLANFFGR